MTAKIFWCELRWCNLTGLQNCYTCVLTLTVSMGTRNTLDCDQSNYSSRIVFSHIPIVLGQTGIKIRRTRKPHIRTKHGVNRTIRRGDIAI